MSEPVPALLALRGYPRRYPENTLEGLEAALRAGARWVGVDVQLSAERVPVLFRDASLQRTTGRRGRVHQTPLERLRRLCPNEPQRFHGRFAKVALPTLEEAVALLLEHPGVGVFAFLGQESLEAHGREKALKAVVPALAPLGERCVLAGGDALALRTGRAMGIRRIAWVLPALDEEARSQAAALVPEYLVAEPPPPEGGLWRGPWRWVFAEVSRPAQARELLAAGAALVATPAIGELLKALQEPVPS
ncbi:MAG: glycerophosphodiester phosphodiesterase [Gammaproteobacteria bacterium]|nr:MAG: glycerophosphodiester phosphodiesterase [Gammaproteobacteria bacterium]